MEKLNIFGGNENKLSEDYYELIKHSKAVMEFRARVSNSFSKAYDNVKDKMSSEEIETIGVLNTIRLYTNINPTRFKKFKDNSADFNPNRSEIQAVCWMLVDANCIHDFPVDMKVSYV